MFQFVNEFLSSINMNIKLIVVIRVYFSMVFSVKLTEVDLFTDLLKIIFTIHIIDNYN